MVSPSFYGGKGPKGSYVWQMLFYNNGVLKDYCSLYVRFTNSEKSTVRVSIELSALDGLNQKIARFTDIDHSIRENEFIGAPHFLEHNRWNSAPLIEQGTMKIECQIRLSSTEAEVMQQEDKLLITLWNQYMSNEFVDTTIVVKGSKFHVHKAIISAHSRIFTEEINESEIIIENCDPDVFSELIRYMYRGVVENLDKVSQGLFIVADKYNVQHVKSVCEIYLASKLSVENVVDLLILADLNNSRYLKKEALEYLQDNGVHTDEDLKKIVHNPELCTTVLKHLLTCTTDAEDQCPNSSGTRRPHKL